MYQIQPYDLSQSFRLIPEKKKYILTFYGGNSVSFTSKRKAFDFIGKISNLFVEALAICEMVNNSIHSFSFHIKPSSIHVMDKYNVYHENYTKISEVVRTLKFYQSRKIELYQVVKLFETLFALIVDNCKILNAKNYNCVVPYQVIAEKAANSLWSIIENADEYYQKKSLSLFVR